MKHTPPSLVSLGLSLFLLASTLLAPHATARFTTTTAKENVLLILMYHGILPDDSAGLTEYVVSVSEFESDLQWLCAHQYQSVSLQQVIACVNEGQALPSRAVLLTFDDGYYNNYLYAYPLLQRYAFSMVLSPIGRWSDFYSNEKTADARYTHVTWEQLREMTASGLVEVGNHSYDLHTTTHGRQGSAKKKGESTAAYQQLLYTDVQRAQERFAAELGQAPVVFTYPFGAVSAEAQDVLRDLQFQAAFTCEEKINHLTNDAACLYRLGRYKRPHGLSSDAFFTRILGE